MKLNTKKVLTLLDGITPLKQEENNLTMGIAVSNMILSSKGDSMKSYLLATKVYSEGSVEIDVSELKMIRESVEAYVGYTALVKGQVLTELELLKGK